MMRTAGKECVTVEIGRVDGALGCHSGGAPPDAGVTLARCVTMCDDQIRALPSIPIWESVVFESLRAPPVVA